MEDFIALLEDEDLDLAAVVETWFPSHHNSVTAQLNEIGYNICHFVREQKKGGGVALIYKKSFKVKSSKTYSFDTFECIRVTISSHVSGPLNLVIVYRYCELNPSLFLTEFHNFIHSIYVDFIKLIILGDFNLHVNKILSPTSLQFQDILSSFSMSQLVNGPTHELGNTLDLIIANSEETDIRDIKIDFSSKSDHAYIFFKIGFEPKHSEKKTIAIKNFKNMNLEQFRSDLSTGIENYVNGVDTSCFYDALCEFNVLCETLVSEHVETKTVNIPVNSRPKWMDSDFIKTRAERRRLYRCWKRAKGEPDRAIARSNFTESRAKTHALATEKKSSFYATKIANCNNSHKELFNVCKSLLDEPKSSKLPTYINPTSMANNFNNFFIEKIEKLRSSFSEYGKAKYNGMDTYNGPIMTQFRLVLPVELKKIISSKPIKASHQDQIPTILLRACLDELLPALTLLVNLSLTSGSMEGLKESVITPILKKAGLDPEVLKHYRPVCNTLFLSKSIERVVILQANEHMDIIDAHIKNQSGYKPKHSCETLLIRLTNDILINSDNSKCTIILLLDLSAAFDTVDHEILLDILWYELGFRGDVFRWFVDFLRNRTQAVSVDGVTSDFMGNRWGVPQGSVVGPFLFNVYVRNLIKILEKAGFTVHGYADDHQILYSFQIDFQVSAIRRTIPQCLDLISNYMKKHFLKLNPSKSQVIVFHPKSCSGKIVFDQLMLSDGSFIPISSQVNNLGVLLDSMLTYSPHITSTVAQGYFHLRNLAGIRKYLSVDNQRTLVNSIVIAKVDNCNSLLYGISHYDSNKLQLFQNSCARFIFRKKKFEHVSGILRELHWLPSEARVYFKVLCYVFKSLHELAPSYLSELIHISRVNVLLLDVPRSRSKVGDRAFSRVGPRLWNALPKDIRLIESLDRFKSQLKHLLYSSFAQYKQKVNIYRT